MIFFFYFFIGAAAGAFCAGILWYAHRKTAGAYSLREKQQWQSTVSTLSAEKERLSEKALLLEQLVKEGNIQLASERDRAGVLQTELAKTKAEYTGLQERLSIQKKDLEELQKRFTYEFESLAQKVLDVQSKKFIEQNKVNLDSVLSPLSERLKDFEKKVEQAYDKEAHARSSLQGEIKKLYELNQLMSKEANNLTMALRGQSKVQGIWGEVILESILEKSGLLKGREFFVQETVVGSDGGRQRPDIIIRLPDQKNMIIDAKVSLTAYERYCATTDVQEKENALQAHINSLRRHIKELSDKKYQQMYQINTPDFVLMFFPIEPAFGLAVQHDPNLFYYAFEQNIVLVSPTTLLATLRTIATLWRQEYQHRNAHEIARAGGALYDKFVAFIEDLRKIGQQLKITQVTYEEAMGKLSTGRGNLVRRIEEMKKLGVKATKALPLELVETEGSIPDIPISLPQQE